MPVLTVTTVFSANTLIKSSEINQNFTDVQNVVNALTSVNFAAGAVNTAALATASATSAKGGLGIDTSSSAQGGIAYLSAVGTWSILTAGTAGQILQTGGASANPSFVSGMTLVGRNDTEVTFTTTADNTVQRTISSLSVPATASALITVNFRKTTGAAAALTIGLRLNNNIQYSTATAANVVTGSTNAAEDGFCLFYFSPQPTGYSAHAMAWFINAAYVSGATTTMGVLSGFTPPASPVTSLDITGKVGSASITGAINNVRVYMITGV